MKPFPFSLGQYFGAALSAGVLLAFSPNAALSDETATALRLSPINMRAFD